MRRLKVLTEKSSDHARRIADAVSLVNAVQNRFCLEVLGDRFNTKDQAVSAAALYKVLKADFPDEQVMAVISCPFDDNWFSHPLRDCHIITLADWEQHFAPPSLRAYLAYHLAEGLLSFAADWSEGMHVRHAHEPPRGCISDFTSNKGDIKTSMVAGNICPECEAVLLRYGADVSDLAAIRRVLDAVREEAIGRPRILDPDAAFVMMRFSTNDENDNAYKYGVRPGLKDVGLEVRRADDTVQSEQILDKVLQYIQRCRFIVAKVDVENLNIYFELGAAMGLGKDVLLVSESSLVLKLPSDLRNWECLTYDKGNYEQLRRRIVRYYVDNFGLTSA